MLESNSRWRMALAASLILALSACGNFSRRHPADSAVHHQGDQMHLDLTADQLLAFGGEFARENPAGRLTECQKLAQTYGANRQLSTLLRLFSAQLVTEGCGDLARTTRVVHAFSGQIQEERLKSMLSYQLLLAERNIAATAERIRLGRRLDYARYNFKKALSESRQAVSSSRQALSKQREALSEREQARSETKEIYRQMISRDAEARQLKEKLDALKSIEQDLNDTER